MIFGILTLITALCISAVAIYYSVAGLVAIFAAAAVPIMIMGGTLEVAKLVTAVWLHKYWHKATWWIKAYLSTAVFVLMLITSMGIFGFLSKAHIEQTTASEESVAKIEQIDIEVARQQAIIERAEKQISNLESSGTGADANIQSQIDKEQERIDRAFERIQPAIAQHNKIIDYARANDATRTKPYEDQLANIQAEVLRLETSAREYEDKIATLSADTSAVDPLLEQIDAIEQEIIRVTNQVNSGERDQIRAGQAIIGVTSDGAFGNNTRKALVSWVAAQRDRITQIQGEVSQLRVNATSTIDAERTRLAGVVKDIRETQIPALKERELTMLGKIDEVRQTESPAIATARDEIQRLRASAESQVAQSQALIERLRGQLAQADKATEIDSAIDEQNTRIKQANTTIDTLTEEKYTLQAEYRKLEAEVGPVKYIAEFVYGERADTNMLEEAVRWVIVIIIFVFDPLAVLLLIASQYTFEWRRSKDDDGDWLRQYEQARAQRIVDNPGFNIDDSKEASDEDRKEDSREEQQDAEELRTGQDQESIPPETRNDPNVVEASQEEGSIDGRMDIREAPATPAGAGDSGRDTAEGMALAGDTRLDIPDTKNKMFYPEELEQIQVQSNDSEEVDDPQLDTPEEAERRKVFDELMQVDTVKDAKQQWKAENPNENLKTYKRLYIKGKIENLPWLESYEQNSEQNENSLWNKINK
jgi:hypothetical protein